MILCVFIYEKSSLLLDLKFLNNVPREVSTAACNYRLGPLATRFSTSVFSDTELLQICCPSMSISATLCIGSMDMRIHPVACRIWEKGTWNGLLMVYWSLTHCYLLERLGWVSPAIGVVAKFVHCFNISIRMGYCCGCWATISTMMTKSAYPGQRGCSRFLVFICSHPGYINLFIWDFYTTRCGHCRD